MMQSAHDIHAQYQEAEKRFLAGDIRTAVNLCQQILNLQPDYAPAYYLTGAIFKSIGNVAKALDFTLLAISHSSFPTDAAYLVQQGECLLALNRMPEALQIFQQAIILQPDRIEPQLIIARLYLQSKREPDAREILEKAAAREPRHEVWNALAECALARNDHETAQRLYNEMCERWPGCEDGYTGQAALALILNDFNTAHRLLLKALALTPRSDKAHYLLARTLFKMDQPQQAVDSAMRAIQLNPRHIDAYAMLTNLFSMLDMYDEAEDMCRKALEVAPTNSRAFQQLVTLLFRRGAVDVAKRYITKMREFMPDDPALVYFENIAGGKQVTEAPRAYVAGLFDTYAENFDDHLTRQLHYHVPEHLASLLKRTMHEYNIPMEQLSLLDLGCGTGLFAEAMKEYTQTRIGVDLSPKMLVKAGEKKVYDTLVEADIVDYMLQSEAAFDVVAATDVFVYIGALELFFNAARRVLKQEGFLVFSVESEKETASDFVVQFNGRYRHHSHYIARLAREAGFEICAEEATIVREELKLPVPGALFILRKTTLQ